MFAFSFFCFVCLFFCYEAVYCSTFVALDAMRLLCLFIKLTLSIKCTKVEQYTVGMSIIESRIESNSNPK